MKNISNKKSNIKNRLIEWLTYSLTFESYTFKNLLFESMVLFIYQLKSLFTLEKKYFEKQNTSVSLTYYIASIANFNSIAIISFPIYELIFYFVCFILLLYLLFVFLIGVNTSKTYFMATLKRISFNSFTILIRVLFPIFAELFLSNLLQSELNGGVFGATQGLSLICFIILFILGIVWNVLYQPMELISKNILVTFENATLSLLFLFDIVPILLTEIDCSKMTNTGFLIINIFIFLICFIKLVYIFKTPRFLLYKAEGLVIGRTIPIVITSFMMTIRPFLGNFSLEYIILIFLIVVIPMTFIFLNQRRKDLVSRKLSTIKDVQMWTILLLEYSLKLEEIKDAMAFKENLVLKGIIQNHINLCTVIDCSCKQTHFYSSVIRDFIPASLSENISFFTKNLVIGVNQSRSMNDNDDYEIDLFNAAIYVSKIKNLTIASLLIKKIRKQNIPLRLKLKIKIIVNYICKYQESNIQKKKSKEGVFEDILDVENYYRSAIVISKEIVEKKLLFWNYQINLDRIEKDKLIEMIRDISDQIKELLELLDKISSYRLNHPKFILFVSFIDSIVFNKKSGIRLDESDEGSDLNKKLDTRQKIYLSTGQGSVICINSESRVFGQIYMVSENYRTDIWIYTIGDNWQNSARADAKDIGRGS